MAALSSCRECRQSTNVLAFRSLHVGLTAASNLPRAGTPVGLPFLSLFSLTTSFRPGRLFCMLLLVLSNSRCLSSPSMPLRRASRPRKSLSPRPKCSTSGILPGKFSHSNSSFSSFHANAVIAARLDTRHPTIRALVKN